MIGQVVTLKLMSPVIKKFGQLRQEERWFNLSKRVMNSFTEWQYELGVAEEEWVWSLDLSN